MTGQLAQLRLGEDRFVLIIIGHGHSSGYVDLMNRGLTNVVSQYQVTVNDINTINPRWYIGLHCYAKTLIDGLNQVVQAYGISGNEPAQNSHIINLIDDDSQYKSVFSEFLGAVASEGEIREERSQIIPWKHVNEQKAFVRHVNQ